MNWEVSGIDSFFAYVNPRQISDDLILELIRRGEQSATGRARLCLHEDVNDPLNIMLIYHDQRTSVPVHRHAPFGEYVILHKGAAEVTFLNDSLERISSVKLRDDGSGARACWVSPDRWHTLKFEEPTLFYELSQGPYNAKRTSFVDVTNHQ